MTFRKRRKGQPCWRAGSDREGHVQAAESIEGRQEERQERQPDGQEGEEREERAEREEREEGKAGKEGSEDKKRQRSRGEALANACANGALASLEKLYIHGNFGNAAKEQLKAACQPRGINTWM